MSRPSSRTARDGGSPGKISATSSSPTHRTARCEVRTLWRAGGNARPDGTEARRSVRIARRKASADSKRTTTPRASVWTVKQRWPSRSTDRLASHSIIGRAAGSAPGNPAGGLAFDGVLDPEFQRAIQSPIGVLRTGSNRIGHLDDEVDEFAGDFAALVGQSLNQVESQVGPGRGLFAHGVVRETVQSSLIAPYLAGVPRDRRFLCAEAENEGCVAGRRRTSVDSNAPEAAAIRSCRARIGPSTPRDLGARRCAPAAGFFANHP